MTRLSRSLALPATLAISSCDGPQPVDMPVIPIDPQSLTVLSPAQDALWDVRDVLVVDGTIWALTASAPNVHGFGPTGKLTGRFGRVGEGPGEFRFPSAIWPGGSSGSLTVWDSGSFAALTFSTGGALLSSSRTPLQGAIRSDIGTVTWWIRLETSVPCSPCLGIPNRWASGSRIAYMRSRVRAEIERGSVRKPRSLALAPRRRRTSPTCLQTSSRSPSTLSVPRTGSGSRASKDLILSAMVPLWTTVSFHRASPAFSRVVFPSVFIPHRITESLAFGVIADAGGLQRLATVLVPPFARQHPPSPSTIPATSQAWSTNRGDLEP